MACSPPYFDIEVDREITALPAPPLPRSRRSSRPTTQPIPPLVFVDDGDGISAIPPQITPPLRTAAPHPPQAAAVPGDGNSLPLTPGFFKIVGCVSLTILFIIIFSTVYTAHKKAGGKTEPADGSGNNITRGIINCSISLVVSQNGSGDFSTITEAIDAAPSTSPVRVCIHIRAGTYNERLRILSDKTNIALIGEGAEKTRISSNASLIDGLALLPATLNNDGNYLLVEDLTLVNTADQGLVLDNWGRYTVFSRCLMEGRNATLHVKGKEQFYGDCQIYGHSNLVSGYGQAFFQNSSFFGRKSKDSGSTTLLTESCTIPYISIFIFQRCHFSVRDELSDTPTSFLSGPLSGASVVILQSDIDLSIDGYYPDGLSPPISTYYAIYNNTDGMKKLPPFVHRLGDVEIASQYSLRRFLYLGNWIPVGVAYDLDL